ncbi:MAG: PilZ domain-containing protein [Planctomycetota bacterium]|jgi:hypothetical protein
MTQVEPQNLIDVLERLKSRRQDPPIELNRNFPRFIVRVDARLEGVEPDKLSDSIDVQLRDMSLGGVGFLSGSPLTTGAMWRLRFMMHDQVIGAQPLVIRYCNAVQQDLYLVGGQFTIEPSLLSIVGVTADKLTETDGADQIDRSEFQPSNGVFD